MKQISEQQFEDDIKIISNLKSTDAPDFFYTRLKARMDKELIKNNISIPLKPILVICVLTLFLFINSLMIEKDSNTINNNSDQNIEAFAAAYDQNISN